MRPTRFGTAYFAPSNFEVTSIDVGNPATNVIPPIAEAGSTSVTTTGIRPNSSRPNCGMTRPTCLPERLELGSSSIRRATPSSPSRVARPVFSHAVRDITGLTPSLSTDGGTSDARFIKELCPVVEFGLLTTTIHKANEQVALADLRQLTAIYRRFLDLYFEEFEIYVLDDPRPIGVFDSGMGGLTVLRALAARLPQERFIYLGDTARLPYGTKSAETVTAYALQATRLLTGEGVKMVVVACNTASAVALEPLARRCAGAGHRRDRAWRAPGVAATRNGRIAVIATEGTVKGGAYLRAIQR